MRLMVRNAGDTLRPCQASEAHTVLITEYSSKCYCAYLLMILKIDVLSL